MIVSLHYVAAARASALGVAAGSFIDRRLTSRLPSTHSHRGRNRRLTIPLHTNGSENDIRCHVTKRKTSGATWSEAGRDARDACLGLMKTCQKQGLPFFDYLGARLGVPNAPLIAPLSGLIRAHAST